jgi:hypothetical protein
MLRLELLASSWKESDNHIKKLEAFCIECLHQISFIWSITRVSFFMTQLNLKYIISITITIHDLIHWDAQVGTFDVNLVRNKQTHQKVGSLKIWR